VRVRGRIACGLVVLSVLCAVGPASAGAAPERYIVVLDDASGDPAGVAAEHGRRYGVVRELVYRHALSGYAVRMSESARENVAADPRVRWIGPDREVRLHAAPTEPAPPPASQPAQVPSSAISRLNADVSSTRSGDGKGLVPVNVAVVDDGMDVDHPDLNVVGGFDCITGQAENFGENGWHGTMVAGFIGARDNAIGRVGVAPAARIYSVRMMNAQGFGSTARELCAVDWVTGTRTDADPTNDIAVANASYGAVGAVDGACGTAGNQPSRGDVAHQAYCRSTAAGVTWVASAGNESADAESQIPSGYPEVLSITAMADNDRQPGGLGGQLACLPEQTDDQFALFSNYVTTNSQARHTVAAPGACIGSLFPDDAYALSSGTSFSAPLVTGTVALCIHSGSCKGLTPAQIITKIVADAETYNRRKPGYGFLGDPLRPFQGRHFGFLINAGLY
jgi:subtilisin